MPGKGSRIVTFRLPLDMELAINAAMDRAVSFRKGEPWSISTFIKAAIKEKLAHLERSRGRKKRAGKQTGATPGE